MNRLVWRNRRSHGSISVIVGVACLAMFAGCTMTQPKQSATMKSSELQFTVDATQLRIQVRALVDPLCGIIEETADEIFASSSDPRIRRAALVWKLDAVPAMREAIFRPDPLAALFDAGAFGAQMVDYFETGDGRALLCDHADAALDAARRVRRLMGETASKIADDASIEIGRQFIDDWAEAHPIVGSIAGRQTVLNQVATLKRQAGLSGMKLVGSLAVSLDDLSRLLELYSDQVMRQWRWQVELMILDLEIEYGSHPTFTRLPGLFDSAQNAMKVTETLPELAASEREAVIAALDAQIAQVLRFTTTERMEVLEQFATERLAAFEELERIRRETLDELQVELELTRVMVREERAATVKDAGLLAADVIDQAFGRLAQLVAAVVIILLVAGGIAVVMLRRRLA